MEYPIWHLAVLGGGFWIALIGTFHVFLAHFAVGGGLYLALAERYARRLDSPRLLAHVKKHARFFLLVTMVAGGVTGVGIWFIIGLLSPQATSTLLKLFVYAFATEWVFFLVEIVALLLYYYGFDRMAARDHLILGWAYFIAAFCSLFMINGIIGFMLTPGAWITTRAFWDAFFNPTFWPQLVLRTAIALSLAGLFGFVTATRIPDDDGGADRERMIRMAAAWTILPLLVCVGAGWWYIHKLPQAQYEMVLLRSARIAGFFKFLQAFAGFAALGALALAVRMPRRMRFPLALVIVLTGWGLIGSFEFIREAARKPFLIYDHTYSNGIHVGTEEAISAKGYLATAKWARIRVVTPENRLAAGAELFQHQCASCHSLGGPMNSIRPWAASLTEGGLDALLGALRRINPAMPPFVGNKDERGALAAYLAGLSGRKNAPAATMDIKGLPVDIPSFDIASANYVLLAWPDLGMHMNVAAQGVFVLRESSLELNAELIKRGESPEKVTEGVTLTYALEGGRGSGVLAPLSGRDWFGARFAVSPRRADGSLDPYPLATVTAANAATGEKLVATRVVLPVSDEVDCASCHGGGDGKGNITGQTGLNILRIHDRLNRTRLVAQARAVGKGKTVVRCASCHADALSGGEGRKDLLGLSAAIHGFHANTLRGQGPESCARCHPSRPDGGTRFQHGLHARMGMDCTNCHGPLEDHAIGLLKREAESGKRGAKRLLSQITPQLAAAASIPPRSAWVQTSDCLACHKDFGSPDPSQAFGHWTKGPEERFRTRLDEMGALPCPACHGPQHALYPSDNPYGAARDNLQPLQYQKLARAMGARGNCIVCHKKRMEVDAHHPNTIKPL